MVTVLFFFLFYTPIPAEKQLQVSLDRKGICAVMERSFFTGIQMDWIRNARCQGCYLLLKNGMFLTYSLFLHILEIKTSNKISPLEWAGGLGEK
jgi:hypothetical protein